MEVIADLDLEPETDLDNIFRNSINDCKYSLDYCQEYIQFLSQYECEYLEYLLTRLRFNKVDKKEVYTYLLEKYEYRAIDCNNMCDIIYGILDNNDKGLCYCSEMI